MNNDTITIPLSKTGKYAGMYEAIVSIEDAEYVLQFNWCVHIETTSIYAVRSPRIDGKKRMLKLHRVILARKLERELLPDEWCDHVDGDGLNCARPNLRLATKSQNAQNARKSIKNTSGYKGVTFNKSRQKYRAYIKTNGKEIHLGYHVTAELANEVCIKKRNELHGEFANHGD